MDNKLNLKISEVKDLRIEKINLKKDFNNYNDNIIENSKKKIEKNKQKNKILKIKLNN